MFRTVPFCLLLALLGLALPGFGQGTLENALKPASPTETRPVDLRRFSVLVDAGATGYFGDMDGPVTPQGALYVNYF